MIKNSSLAISDQRLIMFSLISEIEGDFRDVIINHVLLDHSLRGDIGIEAYENAVLRAKLPNSTAINDESIILPFLDIGDILKIILSNRSLLPKSLSRSITSVIDNLSRLPAIRNRVMHRRPMQFDDYPTINEISRRLSTANRAEFSRTSIILNSIEKSDKLIDSYAAKFSFEYEPSILHNLPQPDFEDTGFMGRTDQVDDLRKAIDGPYPVVTVLGVGGVGKSALALNVAYDILNDKEAIFDAIIWTTAKTTRLTGADVESIVDSIADSVGIAKATVKEFGIDAGDDPFSTVIDLLKQFKVLLFIDNLETILDDKVRSFVRKIPSGSKVVFTSRVGLGAYDFVIPVHSLTSKESMIYFRRVASVRKIQSLVRLHNDIVSGYCVRLNYTPLGIKWFVHAVSIGASAQGLLAEPKVFLEFCFGNIIEKLSQPAQFVLTVLAVTGREHSRASLHYISEVGAWETEESLRELIASNLVSVISSNFGEDDRYRISALAQTYVGRVHAPSISVQSEIRIRQTQLDRMSEASLVSTGFIYAAEHIWVRPDFAGTDSVSANYLRRAIRALHRSDYEEAAFHIDQAKSLSPTYFEVFRIDAMIAAQVGNTIRAQGLYEEAIALRPDYPPIRIQFANFLMKYMGSNAQAEVHIRIALEQDPNELSIVYELARAELYQGHFDHALLTLSTVDVALARNKRARTIYYDLMIQAYSKKVDYILASENISEAILIVNIFSEFAVQIPDGLIDYTLDGRIRNVILQVSKFIGALDESIDTSHIIDALEPVCGLIGVSIPSSNIDRKSGLVDDEIGSGVVDHLPEGKMFGFVKSDDGERLFFHKNHFVKRVQFSELTLGVRLSFGYGTNPEGRCAVNVVVL